MSLAWILCLVGSLAWFVLGQFNSWDCAPRSGCVEYEEWIGNAADYAFLHFAALLLKIVTIIVFCVALIRIRNLVKQLMEQGYIASRRVLYLHIALSFCDLLACLIIGMTSADHAEEAISGLRKGNSAKAYKMLSALNFNQLYQVPNSLMMIIVLYFVLKYMRNAE